MVKRRNPVGSVEVTGSLPERADQTMPTTTSANRCITVFVTIVTVTGHDSTNLLRNA